MQYQKDAAAAKSVVERLVWQSDVIEATCCPIPAVAVRKLPNTSFFAVLRGTWLLEYLRPPLGKSLVATTNLGMRSLEGFQWLQESQSPSLDQQPPRESIPWRTQMQHISEEETLPSLSRSTSIYPQLS